MAGVVGQRRQLLLIGTVAEGGLAGLAWLLGWLLDQPPLESFQWGFGDAAWGAAASLPMLLAFWFLLHWPLGPFASIKDFCDEVARPLFRPCTLLDLALISLLAGVGEEMLFRGVLQGAIGRWLGPWVGLAVAGSLFGLAHLITPTYAVMAALFGFYLGWLWMVNGNLLTAITAHALYDFLALVYLVRGPSAAKGLPVL
jgi:hypothetical protein